MMAVCWRCQMRFYSSGRGSFLNLWLRNLTSSDRMLGVSSDRIPLRVSPSRLHTSRTFAATMAASVFTRHLLLHVKSTACISPQTQVGHRSISRAPDVYGSQGHSGTVRTDVEDSLGKDQMFKEVFEDHYLLPSSGHRVYVIQPDVRQRGRQGADNRAQLKLDEACALVDSLPGWSVGEKNIFSTKAVGHKYIFGKGKFADVSCIVRATAGITAVFVSVNMLTAIQLAALQQAWKMPVYDRYTVVLQIFRTRARTTEAKLQVTLAEIPYLRSRIHGMHTGRLDHQKGGMAHIGGAGETFLEIRHRLLQERELKIKKALDKIRSNRDLLRKERTKREIPVVAVVGYTNAGKTSLIKALTGEKQMVPRDQLFATLDVTVHAGYLGNHLKVLYTDTVGFISDIPTDLVHSFSATLDDVGKADVIVHVRDISHPDCEAQRLQVLSTLKDLGVSQKLMDSIIEVCNKVDLLPQDEEVKTGLLVSTVTGEGLGQLQTELADAVMENTDRKFMQLKVPMSGQHVSWLYKEATVVDSTADDTGEYLVMEVVLTQAAHAKFIAKFGEGKRKNS